MKYEYQKISVPKELKEKCEISMKYIGCRTLTTFVSLAIIDYIKKITEENKQEE